MARCFAKVLEEEIEEVFFYPSDLVNTKITIPLRVGEERWIYPSTLRVSAYIHRYSPLLRGIVVYYYMASPVLGKSPCSDWFFLAQDFAVRSNPCIFVLERGRQIQHLQPKQRKKKSPLNVVILNIETTRRS